MKILKVAVGNSVEAFIESNLSSGLNIISSDDNNKGKTIVIQSMMYALGNDPTFPTSFNYKKHYHYVEFEIKGTIYMLCRYGNGFVIKHGTTLMLLDNVSELKRYWNKNIFSLPSIIKNQVLRIVDPVLFMQLFFVGQDKKDTSNIAHNGFYNKQDFIEMLYAFMGLGAVQLSQDEVDELKRQISGLEDEKKLLKQQHKILKSKKTPASYVSSESDRLAFGEKISSLERIQGKITDYRKERANASTRKSKWEATIKELRSLNRTVACGELRCMDCNSNNISFSTSEPGKISYSFDISTTEMRNEIIASITEKIASYAEEIERLTAEIGTEQERMKFLMEDESVSLEAIVAYKKDIFSASDAENRIKEIDMEISTLKAKLLANADAHAETQEQRNAFLSLIIKKMNEFYKRIDLDGNILYSSLFTQKNEVYSGSEATVFHLVKLFAIQFATQHELPIIIDSFRAEDLSSAKEAAALAIAQEIANQIIFTTTLKDEEVGKYEQAEGIHNIDYYRHSPSKILEKSYVSELIEILSNMAIELH